MRADRQRAGWRGARPRGRACSPADPDQRREVEEAEGWANETLQMAARRIALAWAVRDPAGSSRSVADGRMGYLLYRHTLTRRLIIPQIGRLIFAVDRAAEPELLADLPAMLDRIDAWIADGVLGGAQLNAADSRAAPSLALILYRPAALPLFEARPALGLVDRLLPEPAWARAARAQVSSRGERFGAPRPAALRPRADVANFRGDLPCP